MTNVITAQAMKAASKAYDHLPPFARSEVASLRGLQLRRQRYSSETETLVAEILERDRWSPDRWASWQEARVAEILHRARHHVPAYRNHWDSAGGDWTDLANWPVLEKSDLRRDAGAYVADDLSARDLAHDHTSGTTGASLDLWLRKENVQLWYAMSEARWRRWYGVSLHDRWGMIGGQLVVPVKRSQPPFWVWNRPLKQLYMSSYHLAPGLIDHYLDAIASRGLRYLLGYPSSLYALAKGALQAGRTDIQLEVVIGNAEPLLAHQREAIGHAFGCPVRETYGMSEIAAAASECEHGRLHVWSDAGIVEVDAPDLEAGDLIATGLVNDGMPLIRYRVGDRVRLSSDSCPCGRGLPLLDHVEGRSDDVLFTRDGRRVGRLDPVFKDDIGIAEAQIIQETLDVVRVRYVPGERTGARAEAILADRLRERMGDVQVAFEPVDRIPRTANGKFRAVVCDLGPEIRAEIEAVH